MKKSKCERCRKGEATYTLYAAHKHMKLCAACDAAWWETRDAAVKEALEKFTSQGATK